jgi:hypothetical protein
MVPDRDSEGITMLAVTQMEIATGDSTARDRVRITKAIVAIDGLKRCHDDLSNRTAQRSGSHGFDQ